MKRLRGNALGLLLLMGAAIAISGQATVAKIFGVVKGENGERLGSITVTAMNIQNNATRTFLTAKKSGSFRFLGLEPGFYQVSVDKDGFEPYVVSGIRLSADQSVTLKVKLKKKAPAEPVSPNG